MDNPKYKLVEATEEEKTDFMKKFNDLLNETSIYFEPVPQFSRESLQSPWEVKCQIFLQKKVLDEDNGVISPIQDVNTAETE